MLIDKKYVLELDRRIDRHYAMLGLGIPKVEEDPNLVILIEPDTDDGLVLFLCEGCKRPTCRFPEDYAAMLELNVSLCCTCALKRGEKVSK